MSLLSFPTRASTPNSSFPRVCSVGACSRNGCRPQRAAPLPSGPAPAYHQAVPASFHGPSTAHSELQSWRLCLAGLQKHQDQASFEEIGPLLPQSFSSCGDGLISCSPTGATTCTPVHTSSLSCLTSPA